MTIDKDQALAAAAEPPTPLPWCAGVDTAPNGTLNGLLFKSNKDVFDGTLVAHEDVQTLAFFTRPADARHAAACVKAFAGMPTLDIERMAETVPVILGAMLVVRSQLSVVASAASDDDAWAALRENLLAHLNQPKPTLQ